MHVRQFQTGPEMLAAAGAMLDAREAENSLLVGSAQAERALEGCERAMAAFSGSTPAAAMIQTAINEAIISTGVGVAARALGRALADAGTRSRGVVGPRLEADAAAGAFAGRAGVSTRLQRRLLLHRLSREPVGGEAGPELRAAQPGDEGVLVRWALGFEGDTNSPPHARDAERRVRQGIGSGRLFVLWDGSERVAAASWARPTRHTRTINCVYTPPGQRGRGRGGAVTALLARRLLEMGTRDVLLFTDADDAVPNRVYARVGFTPVAEFVHWEFVWPGT